MVKLVDTTDLSSVGQRCPCRFKSYWEYLVDLLSGMYIEEKGLASYTFPDDAEKFNESSLKKCRVEASLPSAARLVLTDEHGNEKSCGLEGWHNLYNTSLYFNIVADNGDTKNFKIQTRCQN